MTIFQNSVPMFAFSSEMKQINNLQTDEGKLCISQFPCSTYYKYKCINNNFYYIMSDKYAQFGLYSYTYDYNLLLSENIYLDMIRNQLTSAVIKRVDNTDRTIACLLSGGLDSSLITSLVCRYCKYQVETYSIGLKDAEDLQYARQVADFLNTKHTEIIVEEKDFLDAIKEVIQVIESYDTTSVRASVGNYLIGKYISKNSNAKVIFNGDGSDELTGGYLYMQHAPNALSFDHECRRLLKNICYFDVLRSDRCISSHGLEPRTPFLDRKWVEMYLNIPVTYRFKPNKCEKYLLRKAFDCEDKYLPENILWRKKEAFSDGVSTMKRPWYQIIQDSVAKKNIDVHTYSHNNPTTFEQRYYREIFETYYPNQSHVIPYFWMPRYINASDCSARTLDIYNNDKTTN